MATDNNPLELPENNVNDTLDQTYSDINDVKCAIQGLLLFVKASTACIKYLQT